MGRPPELEEEVYAGIRYYILHQRRGGWMRVWENQLEEMLRERQAAELRRAFDGDEAGV